jgi:heat shock protein HtpX
MEMCVDNPREEFADLFATHPSVDSRVAALVKYAGGHDPGKYLDGPQDPAPDPDAGTDVSAAAGPWGRPEPPQDDSGPPAAGPWGAPPRA